MFYVIYCYCVGVVLVPIIKATGHSYTINLEGLISTWKDLDFHQPKRGLIVINPKGPDCHKTKATWLLSTQRGINCHQPKGAWLSSTQRGLIVIRQKGHCHQPKGTWLSSTQRVLIVINPKGPDCHHTKGTLIVINIKGHWLLLIQRGLIALNPNRLDYPLKIFELTSDLSK